MDYIFDFERLTVYQKAMAFVIDIFRLTRGLSAEYRYSLADQLRRAGVSILNNLAEGSGKVSKKEKAKFYKTSLNSARECIPMLTVLVKENQISEQLHQDLRQDVIHISNMLGKLIASLE